MTKTKSPDLDKCRFMEERTDQFGNLPVVRVGNKVTVFYHGFEITVKTKAAYQGNPDLFTGEIIEFESPPEKYGDLTIGNTIQFHGDNVYSIDDPLPEDEGST